MTGYPKQRRAEGVAQSLPQSLRAALAGASAMFAVCASPVFAAPAVAPASCTALVEIFNTATDAGRDKDAQAAIDKVAGDASCAGLQTQMLRRLAAVRLSQAQKLMTQSKPLSAFEGALIAAEKPQVLWQASATLAEVRFGARAFGEAAQAFDRAIEIVKNETLTPVAPQLQDIQRLLDRASQARILAASQPQNGSKGEFVKTASNADGSLGGAFSPLVRGIVPRAVPMPIIFGYRSAELTPVGLQAANELLRALQEQQPQKIKVIGHTDPRGGAEYNLKLSKARAETVATFLRDNGITLPIETEGRGAEEPLQIEAATGLSPDDLNALNRRVEWRRE